MTSHHTWDKVKLLSKVSKTIPITSFHSPLCSPGGGHWSLYFSSSEPSPLLPQIPPIFLWGGPFQALSSQLTFSHFLFSVALTPKKIILTWLDYIHLPILDENSLRAKTLSSVLFAIESLVPKSSADTQEVLSEYPGIKARATELPSIRFEHGAEVPGL